MRACPTLCTPRHALSTARLSPAPSPAPMQATASIHAEGEEQLHAYDLIASPKAPWVQHLAEEAAIPRPARVGEDLRPAQRIQLRGLVYECTARPRGAAAESSPIRHLPTRRAAAAS